MKRRLAWTGAAAAAVLGLAWAFVGAERIVGDHEAGVDWQLFVKQRPSLRLRFANPAQHGLELTPPAAMSAAERAVFVDFCAVRFGETDAGRCHALLAQRGT